MKKSYLRKKENEIKYYEDIFDDNLTQEVPEIWNEVEKVFSNILKEKTNCSNLYEYVERHVLNLKLKEVNILGLGSGACGNELRGIAPLLKKHSININLYCIDINKHALNLAKIEAEKMGVVFYPLIKDVNYIKIEKNKFDVIVAHASLHYFLKLDKIAKQINRSLTQNGVFVTVDIPTKNGYLMWQETHQIVNKIWSILPKKYKIDHTGFKKPKYVESFPNIDYSQNSFECINSEEILPALNKFLDCVCYVPAFAITRRFFDSKFGPNFDLNNKMDRSIFEFIIELDKYYIKNNKLKPETFFGAYRKKQ